MDIAVCSAACAMFDCYSDLRRVLQAAVAFGTPCGYRRRYHLHTRPGVIDTWTCASSPTVRAICPRLRTVVLIHQSLHRDHFRTAPANKAFPLRSRSTSPEIPTSGDNTSRCVARPGPQKLRCGILHPRLSMFSGHVDLARSQCVNNCMLH